MENEILRILPQTVRAVLLHTPESRIEELRLRVGQKPSVLYAGCEQILNAGGVLTQNELQQVLLNASAQSQYAVQEQLRNGYLSLPGGYRIGVCGSTVVQNGCITGIREISSIALRVPHDIRQPPERLLPYLQESCLLAGAPGSGKTTLLRSCIRTLQMSDSAWPLWMNGRNCLERCMVCRSLILGRVRTCSLAVRKAMGCSCCCVA